MADRLTRHSNHMGRRCSIRSAARLPVRAVRIGHGSGGDDATAVVRALSRRRKKEGTLERQ